MDNCVLKDENYDGERPLYKSLNLSLQNVTIGIGESAIKESENIVAQRCRFECKYTLWETTTITCEGCHFTDTARSSLWYSNNILLKQCNIDSPKIFRKSNNITLIDCGLSNALETFWDCNNIHIYNCVINNCDYLFMHASNIDIFEYKQNGNYSFQYAKNVTINNAEIISKDAFWEAENVTIYNSLLDGEYLGWYSKNLKLINCVIKGTQPLCYCENLEIINCEFGEDCDLCFEYSNVNAIIDNTVTSIKNPTSGTIRCVDIKQVIWDNNCKLPHDAIILNANGDIYKKI